MATKKADKKTAKKAPAKVKARKKAKEGSRPDPESPLNKGLTDDQVTHPELPHAEDILAAESDNKDFGKISEPSPTITAVTEKAWNAVRGTDPEWAACAMSFRIDRLGRANAVLKGARPVTDFDREVVKLKEK